MFLIDTNVISALAPSKRQSSGQLVEWLDRASSQLFLSVISAARVKSGIAKAEQEGAATKAPGLKEWWESIEYLYAQKLLPFDLRCAQRSHPVRSSPDGYNVCDRPIARPLCQSAPNIDPFCLSNFDPPVLQISAWPARRWPGLQRVGQVRVMIFFGF
ncbi:PIN domain-containing protein [Rhizobium leguminosarum]|uniref:PIN domain-containing protein n=1 Tax=Rhizobium leguminosarum TaxID=384 RepID=A0A2Z4YTA0_RHILE|nr:hypothetical protein [Rhizobium leguminosarum]AXA43605.1 hypothetical protein DLJ82_7360 [Rhizobium leguminosarum]